MSRRFVAVAVVAALASSGALAQGQAAKTIKMQSTWPASYTL